MGIRARRKGLDQPSQMILYARQGHDHTEHGNAKLILQVGELPVVGGNK